jgi:hypothetical protein
LASLLTDENIGVLECQAPHCITSNITNDEHTHKGHIGDFVFHLFS